MMNLKIVTECSNFLIIKEKACITVISAVVSAAEESSLLCWTEFNCTEMYTVGSDSAIKCESTVSGHDF